MTQPANILSFTARPKRNPPLVKSESLVRECRSEVDRVLPKLVKGLFEKLDDALCEMADKSGTDQLQSNYFDTMGLVRQHREDVQKHFLNGVLGDFDEFWIKGPRNLSPKSLTSDSTETDLSLMEYEELDRSLAVNNIISKGENRFHGELYALTSRFAHLAGDIELGIHSNPLGPAAVCNRFHLAFHNLSVETPVLLVIYKLFDKQMMSHLGGLYEEINALLARAGILPKLAPRPDHAPGRPTGPPVGGGYVSGEVTVQEEMFSTLQELLAGYRPQRQGAGAPLAAEKPPTVATQELLGAMSTLQRVSPEFPESGAGVPKIADLRRHLSNELNLEEENGRVSRALGKEDNDTLDVIAMLFEFLLGDPNLPDAMKVLIARLQIPMLRVAILDKSFFSHKLHPARCLLNNLTWAAMGWSEDGKRSENSLYGRIEPVVNRVVAGFEENPSMFKELNEEFSAYVEREKRSAKFVEERTNQVVQGREQLQVAKQVVGEEIERRLRGQARVPWVARTLLEDGWKVVLMLTYLRQGPESDAWSDNLEVADRLLWSVRPKVEHNQRRDLLRMIPDLQRSLREGLDSISYDPYKMARLFEELQTYHAACLRGGKGPGAGTAYQGRTSPPPVRKETARPAVADEESQAPAASAKEWVHRDRFTDMAEKLESGAWIELREKDGKHSRIKLSWKSDIYDDYLFVNRRGVRVMDMTMAGVAKLFRNGDASILEQADTPIMDRALDSMLETLKSAGDGSA